MQATEIMMSARNAADAMERAEALTKDIDQDWEHEASIYTFEDDSVLVVSGPQVSAYPDREAADASLIGYREVRVAASRYEDEDDCLSAAAEDYAEQHGLRGWDLAPRWEDDRNREVIILTVPADA